MAQSTYSNCQIYGNCPPSTQITEISNSTTNGTTFHNLLSNLLWSLAGHIFDTNLNLNGYSVVNGSAQVNLSGSYGYSLQNAYDNGNTTIYEGLPIYLYNECIDFGFINVCSPKNATYCNTTIDFNVSLNEDGDTCYYRLDSTAPKAWTKMTKFNNTWFNYTKTITGSTEGSHYINFLCNDTSGTDYITPEVYFTVNTSEDCGSNGYIFDSLIAEGRICDINGCISNGGLQQAYDSGNTINPNEKGNNSLLLNLTNPNATLPMIFTIDVDGDVVGAYSSFVIYNNKVKTLEVRNWEGAVPQGAYIWAGTWLPFSDNAYDLGARVEPGAPEVYTYYRWKDLWLAGTIRGQGNISNSTTFAMSSETGNAIFSNVTINNSLCDANSGECYNLTDLNTTGSGTDTWNLNYTFYYNISQIDTNFSLYYTKTETDTNFSLYYTKIEADANWTLYYPATNPTNYINNTNVAMTNISNAFIGTQVIQGNLENVTYFRLNETAGACNLNINHSICSNATGTYIIG